MHLRPVGKTVLDLDDIVGPTLWAVHTSLS